MPRRRSPRAFRIAGAATSGPHRQCECPHRHATSVSPTAKRSETITVSGISFQDDFAWLRNANDPEVAKWIDAQNDFTTKMISGYPGFDDLRARMQIITRSLKPGLNSIRSSRHGFFALRRAPESPQPAIVTVASLEKPDTVRTVFDPTVIDSSGQTSIDWYSVSPDGKRIAVSLSTGGSEEGSLSILDVESGKVVDGPIARVQLAGGAGSAAFSSDGKSIFYTRYPALGERSGVDLRLHQQLYRHVLGGPTKRDERVDIELPDIAEIKLESPAPDGTIIARVHVGDGGQRIWFVGRPSATGYTWWRFADVSDAVVWVKAAGDSLYVLSRKGDLRGAVLRVPLATGRLEDGRVVVPTSERELTDLSTAGDRLTVFDILHGASRARVFDRSGKAYGDVELPARATVTAETSGFGALYVRVESFTTPAAIYRIDFHGLNVKKTPAFEESPARFDDVDIVDETAVSRDGTKVPITLLVPHGVSRSSETPLLLYGYGGYGLGSTPRFDAQRRIWLDQGGIYAVAHIRGGDENGEAWHVGGMLGNKQNVFDDFIASAERLVGAGYTSKSKLAISGASNGGLLVGAVLTQRPDLVRAAVCRVPFLDMVRFDAWPNGIFNRTEFGSVADPQVGPKLLAYSRYQNARPAAYPAVLIISAMNDYRVDPADGRAFAAKLQMLSSSNAPVLLRTWMDSGHRAGANVFKRAEEDAQTYAFLLRELDVPYYDGKSR